MIKQEVFDFHQVERLNWNDFVESDENRDVMNYLRQWNSWQSQGLIIYGESGVGKSHVLTLWAQSANAFNIHLDDLHHNPRELFESQCNFAIDNFEEFLSPKNYNWLFDFLNILKEKQKIVVITAKTSPATWNISLPDLQSRLLLLPALKITAPGDELLFHITKKLAKDLGIGISDNCVEYILNNTTRDVQTIRHLITELNLLSLRQKQSISLPFIKRYLHEEQHL